MTIDGAAGGDEQRADQSTTAVVPQEPAKDTVHLPPTAVTVVTLKQ